MRIGCFEWNLMVSEQFRAINNDPCIWVCFSETIWYCHKYCFFSGPLGTQPNLKQVKVVHAIMYLDTTLANQITKLCVSVIPQPQ